MNIETPELILEELSYKDLTKVHQLYSNPEVNRFSTIGIPKSLDETNEIIQIPILDQYNSSRKIFSWKVILKFTKDFVGIVELKRNIDQFKKGEICIKILPSYWNKGYATNVVTAINNFSFDVLALHRLEATIATENTAAIRVFEKAGYEKEGLLKRNLPIHKTWTDSYLFASLAVDEEEE